MLAAPLSRRAAARLAPLGAVGVRWSASAAVAVHRSPQAPLYPRNIAEYPNVIAHLGVGGFHRSHQAMYLHELLEAKGKEAGWALCGVGLMPGDADMQQKLAAQDFLYTVLSQGNSGLSATVVGSVMDFILVPADPFGAVERLAAPEVKIVSMTVTEKGYCLSVDGILDLKNKLVEAELPVGAPPKSAWGVIYAALALRVRRGVKPFTIMSCDNMPGNGSLAQRTLFEFSSAKAMAGDVFAGEVGAATAYGCSNAREEPRKKPLPFPPLAAPPPQNSHPPLTIPVPQNSDPFHQSSTPAAPSGL